MAKKEESPLDISEDIVIEKTGKSDDGWQRILDKFDYRNKGRQKAEKYIQGVYGLNEFWAEIVTSRYESFSKKK